MNINEAIAAVKANPRHELYPLPWGRRGIALVSGDGYIVGGDLLHIAAAVNAAPLLIAEVERLQAVVEAAREAVEAIKPHHSPCNMGCNCDHCKSDFALLIARRALGLEVGK